MTIEDGAFPGNISKEVRKLMETYFYLSNAASSHNDHEADEKKFAELFETDGMYEFAEHQNVGHQNIMDFRKKLFEQSPTRDHPVVQFFTLGDDDMNLMCYGRVGYKYPEGTTNKKEWAGRYKLAKNDRGELKFKYAQVIIDPSKPDNVKE